MITVKKHTYLFTVHKMLFKILFLNVQSVNTDFVIRQLQWSIIIIITPLRTLSQLSHGVGNRKKIEETKGIKIMHMLEGLYKYTYIPNNKGMCVCVCVYVYIYIYISQTMKMCVYMHTQSGAKVDIQEIAHQCYNT